jgi:tetratricopeptide (TPR) repeat protein
LYCKRGKYHQAASLYQRALTISESTQNPNYASVATSLNNLAELYRAQGNYEQAEPLYKRALTSLEKTLGSEHPYLATVLENYAVLLQEVNRKGEATELNARSEAIWVKCGLAVCKLVKESSTLVIQSLFQQSPLADSPTILSLHS